MSQFEAEIRKTKRYFSSARFKGITRLYSPRQVVEQRGTIRRDYSIAKKRGGELLQKTPGAIFPEKADNVLRSVFTRPGRYDEKKGN